MASQLVLKLAEPRRQGSRISGFLASEPPDIISLLPIKQMQPFLPGRAEG